VQEDRLISLSVAADELKIGHERLRQLAKAGEIAAERRGKLWYLRESTIAALRERGRLKPGPRKQPPAHPPAG
jgi:hypothetical protein